MSHSKLLQSLPWILLFLALGTHPGVTESLWPQPLPKPPPPKPKEVVFPLPRSIQLQSGPALLERLKAGGLVIYQRHFEYDHTLKNAPNALRSLHHRKDPKDFEDCTKQVNLNGVGIQLGKGVGEATQSFQIPWGKVVSSPYCRCVETAKLSTGLDEIQLDGRHLFPNETYPAEEYFPFLKKELESPPKAGTNTLIVGHRSVTRGLYAPEQGEMIVFAPVPGGYDLVARIQPMEWIAATKDPVYLGLSGTNLLPKFVALKSSGPR